MEIAEVLTQMIKRACLYNTPAATTTVTTSTTTVMTTKGCFHTTSSASEIVEDEKADSLDEVVVEPVGSSAASYSNLVSTHLLRSKLKCNK